MTTATVPWFTADKTGLERLVDRRGRHRVLPELPSNAFDENITFCNIDVKWLERGLQEVTIEDDSPDGFRVLSDAWTLFAPSYKTTNPSKRGRFNLGEKLFLAICQSAKIQTTTGTVIFNDQGRTETTDTRERGTVLTATVRMNKEDAANGIDLLRSIIAPDGVVYRVNGEWIQQRHPIFNFTVTLPTEIEGDEGWRPTERKTIVTLYEPTGVERPMIYEMGIPVVQHDGRWHVNVHQKVPLNSDRDNVTPSYLRKLHTAVVNNAFEFLDEEDTTSTWVKEGLPRATAEAVKAVVTKRFGERVVTFDPSDPQANKEAAARGYTVIPPRTFDRATWMTIRSAAIAPAAGGVTPSHATVKHSADGVPPLDREEWTPPMERFARYAQEAAHFLLGKVIRVQYYNNILIRHGAWFGDDVLSFNVGKLGWAFVMEPAQYEVDALLLHELAHDKVSDHLSHEYYRELCRLGARMRDFDLRILDRTLEGERV